MVSACLAYYRPCGIGGMLGMLGMPRVQVPANETTKQTDGGGKCTRAKWNPVYNGATNTGNGNQEDENGEGHGSRRVRQYVSVRARGARAVGSSRKLNLPSPPPSQDMRLRVDLYGTAGTSQGRR